MAVLLGHILSLGLISKSTYSRAVELVHSAIDLPELFGHPARLTEEGDAHGCGQDTQ